MKNYYDELEVSKKASKEVIEKVYKVLAKKYHPDTTKEYDKKSAEEKFKIISEAYEILSNDEKRKKYDIELEQSNPTISYEEYINVVNKNDSLNKTLNNLTNEFNNLKNSYNNNNKHYINTNINSNSYNTSHSSNNTTSSKYYNSATGQPVSSFTYYKYKIKKFFSSIFLMILSLILGILIFNAFSGSNFFNYFNFLFK